MLDLLNQVIVYEYVIYSSEDYQTLSGQFAKRINSAAKIGSEAVSNARAAQINAMMQNMRKKGPLAKQALQAWEELARGEGLDMIMSGIASTLTNKIDQVAMNTLAGGEGSFQGAMRGAYNLAGVFSGKTVEAEKLDMFFNEVVKGVSIMTGGQVPIELFEALSGIGSSFTGGSYSYSGKGVIGPISEEHMRTVERVIHYLSNAAEKHAKEGGVSAQSIRGTLNNIFGSSLGEGVARTVLGNAMPNIEGEIFDIAQRAIAGSKNITLQSINLGKDFQTIGTLQSDKGGTGKVDILNSEGLTLTLGINGSVVDLVLSTNASVKWVKGSEALGLVSNVSLGSRTFGSIMNSGALGAAISNRGIAYNVLAHEGEGGSNFENLRKSIAASFFNEWLMGSGGTLAGVGVADKNQLFFVNGKVYSMLDMVKRAYQEDMSQNGRYGSFSLNMPSVANNWQGSDVNNWRSAFQRSRIVKDLINGYTMRMTVHLNHLGL